MFGAWTLDGAVLGIFMKAAFGVPWLEAMAFGVPLGLAAAPMSTSAWYLSRALPISRMPLSRVAVATLAAALTMAAIWAALGIWWWRTLGRMDVLVVADVPTSRLFAGVTTLGALTYLVVISLQYTFAAFEESADSRRRVLESQIAQREAELTALRAQVDPHFLFNSLNSISGLIGPDPAKARQMCQALAEFLRDCLALGAAPRIALSREIALAEQYLRVEQVRFGKRLAIDTSVSTDTADVPVPPLILQPLVENAVRHGIATCLDGGRIEIRSRRIGERAVVTVANPRDVDGARAGMGLGIGLVRKRLGATFGDVAALVLEPSDAAFRATMTVPIASDPREVSRNG
jgi:hypothetical protein